MLTADQLEQFRVFGYVLLRKAYDSARVQEIKSEMERLWIANLGRIPDGMRRAQVNYFVEQSPLLTGLIEEDELYSTIEQLLGEDFVWGGSEGNSGILTDKDAQHWHADRLGREDTEYPRLKIMLYLDPMQEANGALRVIPGSHRSPMHEELLPFTRHHIPDQAFFGIPGNEVPAQVMRTNPGDMLLFHHSLFHAVYGNQGSRRFIALKFAARPNSDTRLRSVLKWSKEVFEPHDAFCNHPNDRIRRMVDGVRELGDRAKTFADQAEG